MTNQTHNTDKKSPRSNKSSKTPRNGQSQPSANARVSQSAGHSLSTMFCQRCNAHLTFVPSTSLVRCSFCPCYCAVPSSNSCACRVGPVRYEYDSSATNHFTEGSPPSRYHTAQVDQSCRQSYLVPTHGHSSQAGNGNNFEYAHSGAIFQDVDVPDFPDAAFDECVEDDEDGGGYGH